MRRPGRRSGRLMGLLGVLALLAGCGASVQVQLQLGGAPPCRITSDRISGGAVLMAQAVPTAQLVPCVRSIPTGWGIGGFEARRGSAKFWLNSDRDGMQAVTVSLQRGCDTHAATQVSSDQAGARRYERVTRVTGGYGGTRYYVFPGGCVTYRFNLHGPSRAEPVTTATQALGFLTRNSLRASVHDYSHGRLELDPTPTGGAR